MRKLFLAVLFAGYSAVGFAQDIVPDRHFAYSRNVDYPGGDIASYFDTTLDACQSACLATPTCEAFTFNQRSDACFLKQGVDSVTPFDGAMSARAVPSIDSGAVPDRIATLRSVLTDADVQGARQLALDIGRLHSFDENDPAQLIAVAEARFAASDPIVGLRFLGAALSLDDRSDLWLWYAGAVRGLVGVQSSEAAQARSRMVPAAINAFLRALDTDQQVKALIELARALEAEDRGRLMIPLLRLASGLRSDAGVDALLDEAIGRYGFRITGTTVENESTAPRICVEFSDPLAAAGQDYAPFVQLPDAAIAVEVSSGKLCLGGVRHGEIYRFAVRQGLPSANGETLPKTVELETYVRDRSPSVRFLSNANVLPVSGDLAIPVETVNASSIDLSLRRMTDRNLVRTIRDGMFGNAFYDWDTDYFDSAFGAEIWSGTAFVDTVLNTDVLTRIPLDEALDGQPAGVYVLTALPEGKIADYDPAATQWFVVSDLGATSMSGTDGLTVVVRALSDANAVAGAEVALLSTANDILATTVTDNAGVARFDAGLMRGAASDRPALVTVAKGDDLAFLSLEDAAFDLSDRGVEGREPAGPIDVYATTDRGAYHAGETIYMTALMRDDRTAAVQDVPLTAILRRPDGVEYSRVTSISAHAGGHVFALPVQETAPRGTWRIDLFADLEAAPLASTRVLVEDFLPERIDFSIDLPEVIHVSDQPDMEVQADYLFGAPAAGLMIEGEVILRPTDKIAGFDGYHFGLVDDPTTPMTGYVSGGPTDTAGAATTRLELPIYDTIRRPMDLTTILRIAEGSGRPVERRATAAVLPETPVIGIRPLFDGDLPENGRATFAIQSVGPDMQPVATDVVWTLHRLSYRYQWFLLDGRWQWDVVTSRERVATGVATTDPVPVTIEADTTWGRYEIVVESVNDPLVASSLHFTAGWYVAANTATTPDLLDAALDSERYAVGDVARFRIVPRYAGTALVTVMTNRIVHLETVAVQEGENVIPLTVTEDWGAGAYVSASVIRPMDVAAGHNPARALGLGYAAVDPADKALTVSVDVPDRIAARRRLDVGLTVEGIGQGDTAWATVAVVDAGILNLTGFKSPDPQGHFFGQRKLGVELRDLYGSLIDGLNGAMGTVRSGGDAMGMTSTGSPPPTEDLVAYFTGPVEIDDDGHAVLGFDLPAFNGTLRVMAIVWSGQGVGQATREVVVRDPIVLTVSAPRFMAPDDQSRILLELRHTDGPSGEVGLRVASDGLALAPQMLPATVQLAEGQAVQLSLPFAAGDPGTHHVTVTLTTPDGQTLDKTITIPVVANDPAISSTTRMTLGVGERFVAGNNLLAGLVGAPEAVLTIGPLARFDTAGMLDRLDRYPYGCTEQITSRALPLLYFDGISDALGLERGAEDRVAQAIQNVLANQDANGAFGLWAPGSGDMWLDAYVTDFLARARLTGHEVPEVAFRNALTNLRNQINYYPDFEHGGEDLAYALMVLAREGAAQSGDLRYYADQKAGAFGSPMAMAQIGAALAAYGDQPRADRMFARASAAVTERTQGADGWRIDYGSDLRDAAAVLALAAEARSNAVDVQSLTSALVQAGPDLSTQEAVWALLAANASAQSVAEGSVTIDGGPVSVPVRRYVHGDPDMTVQNGGAVPVDLTVTTFGVPENPEPAGGNGFALSRAYFTLDGQPADLSATRTGDRLVVVLEVTPFGRKDARLMVNDALPAGFEIDNPSLLRSGEVAALDWLSLTDATATEFRSDRFLAAVDLRSDQAFRLAYIVRAISPGTFHHPAAIVEDMYRPAQRAWTDSGQVAIAE